MSDDAYELAALAAEHDCVPTCIPIVADDDTDAVAIVTLKPNSIALVALTHERKEIRARAIVSVARKAHELIDNQGFVSRWPS